MAADIVTTHMPATLGTHELVLLHGQPGSPADWLPLAGRLPAQLHAIAAETQRPRMRRSPPAPRGWPLEQLSGPTRVSTTGRQTG